jgi:hypothetical protein
MRRRTPLIALLILLCQSAFAQQRPADLQPLPEVPPPPPMADNAPEPQVTITKRGDDQVEEYRVNGKLYMMKVTPPHGKPYYLIDNRGNGTWSRQEVGDAKLSVPMWVITTF